MADAAAARNGERPAAFIVTIGDELTKGEIPDTNAEFIAGRLSRFGVRVEAILSLPDDRARAVKTFERLLKDDGVYVITGGLGGTRDDVTRKVVSGVLGVEFSVDSGAEKRLESWYRERGRPFLESDRSQAACPQGGILLENPVGLAYGFYVRTGQPGGMHLFALPGVPGEMKAMFDASVLPLLEREGLGRPRNVETLLFAGISEYMLDREIAAALSAHPGVRWGTRSGYDTVKVVLESDREDLEPCLGVIRRRLPESFVARGDTSLEGELGSLLAAKGLTLSAAESCTAGYLSKAVTDAPGSSAYFLGGVVSYSNESKTRLLGVRVRTLRTHGAVSAQTAEEMCRGALERFSSDIAVAITGVAGPGGGSEEKPVGTVHICVLGRGGEPAAEKNAIPGDRESVRRRCVNRALLMLIRHVRGRNGA